MELVADVWESPAFRVLSEEAVPVLSARDTSAVRVFEGETIGSVLES